MMEYNVVKIAGDFNQTDVVLSQAILSNECIIMVAIIVFVLVGIFSYAIIQIFKISNYKSVENH